MFSKRIFLLCFSISLGLAKSETTVSSNLTTTTTTVPSVATTLTNVNATTVVPTSTNQPSSNDKITTVASQSSVNNKSQNGLTTNPSIVETTTSNGYTTTDAPQTTTENKTPEPQNGSKNHQDFDPNATSTTNERPIITNVWDTKNYNYVIIDDTTKVPCTLTKMNITLTVPYKTKENKIATKQLTVPFNANATGTCNENMSLLTIVWQETEELDVSVSDGINELTMNIVKDGDIQYVQYLIVSITLDNLTFPNATETFMNGNSDKNLTLFKTSDPNSVYICNGTQKIQAGDMIVIVDNIEFIAFNTDPNNTSSRRQEFCPAAIKNEPNGKSKNIGIIVGGILIALVGICLIIFIINRYSRKMTSWNIMRP